MGYIFCRGSIKIRLKITCFGHGSWSKLELLANLGQQGREDIFSAQVQVVSSETFPSLSSGSCLPRCAKLGPGCLTSKFKLCMKMSFFHEVVQA